MRRYNVPCSLANDCCMQKLTTSTCFTDASSNAVMQDCYGALHGVTASCMESLKDHPTSSVYSCSTPLDVCLVGYGPFADAGWQHHPVCNRKYHFIIPGNIVLADPHQLPTKVEALLCSQDPSISFAQLTVEAPSGNDSYCAAVSVFESSFHCLHGVLHFNGYGHLVS